MVSGDGGRLVRLLHLSDIHFKAETAWNARPILRELTYSIGKEVAAGRKPDLVVITGDIAWSGKQAEYKMAREWLDKLWPMLGGLEKDRLLLVPGNHDVDRTKTTGGRSNNRAEISHQPTRRRERQRRGFRSPSSAQQFLSIHAAVYNQFNIQRHLISRRTLKALRAEAFAGWRKVVAA